MSYDGWAVRKVARHYQKPPWELNDIAERDVIAEAEFIDLEEEITRVLSG